MIAFVGGVALRTIALGSVPAGFNQDEAVNGYDAYSLLKTGRDHHGNLLPAVIQGFNDYRMPAFQYSLIPLVGIFGLKPWVVRFGTALWGIGDLAAIAALALLLLDPRAAAVAVMLAAVSPWHLALSRFGIETVGASTAAGWGVAAFLFALQRRERRWLFASALVFGLSLYTYSIAKAFVPPMLLLLVALYWRDLRPMIGAAIAALIVLALCAIPQALLIARHGAEMQARYKQISVFTQGQHGWDLLRRIVDAYLSHFGRDFLFIKGDWYDVLHPPGFGQLLPVQAAMAALGAASLLQARWRRPAILFIGWLLIAAIPGTLTTPAPHALHDALAMTPWSLLSALGVVFLLDFELWNRTLRLAAATVLIALALAQGFSFVRFYFGSYPAIAARDYQYGLEQAVTAAQHYARTDEPIVMPYTINQPYIYMLFFNRYPPALFQRGPVEQGTGIFAFVYRFDRYLFTDPIAAWFRLPHGVFVFPGNLPLPAQPVETILFPDGTVAYRILVK